MDGAFGLRPESLHLFQGLVPQVQLGGFRLPAEFNVLSDGHDVLCSCFLSHCTDFRPFEAFPRFGIGVIAQLPAACGTALTGFS